MQIHLYQKDFVYFLQKKDFVFPEDPKSTTSMQETVGAPLQAEEPKTKHETDVPNPSQDAAPAVKEISRSIV